MVVIFIFLSAVFIMHHQTSKRPIFLRHTITTIHDRMHTLLLFSTTLIIFPPLTSCLNIPRIPALCNCITSILRKLVTTRTSACYRLLYIPILAISCRSGRHLSISRTFFLGVPVVVSVIIVVIVYLYSIRFFSWLEMCMYSSYHPSSPFLLDVCLVQRIPNWCYLLSDLSSPRPRRGRYGPAWSISVLLSF